jgi:hypothetical protein
MSRPCWCHLDAAAALDQLLVPGRKVDDLPVPGDEVADQRDRRALLFLQEEVAQVEQRLGPADLPEVDQPV